jgi:hypothetical protein
VTITTARFSINTLLATLPRGEPLTTKRLAKEGLSSTHAAYLASHGWLLRLGRGVFMLPGDTLSLEGCLAFFSSRVPGLHVGGRTALAWRGIRHNVQFREVTELWGNKQVRIPAWLTERFPCRYQVTRLFDNSLSPGFGTAPLPNGRTDVLVSAPERAMLELLSDVGRLYTREDAGNLIESARNLREPVLDQLLAHVTRIKVVRLAREFSEKFEMPWAPLARTHSERLGGAKRWIAVSKTGEVLVLKNK